MSNLASYLILAQSNGGGQVVSGVNSVNNTLLLVLAGIVFGLAAVFIAFGGVQMITSRGSGHRFESGIVSVEHAIIGVIVVLVAGAFVLLLKAAIQFVSFQ
jgi:hypothetical protein